MWTSQSEVIQLTCLSDAQLIGKHIDRVDSLGDIGALNLDKICKIISRNRALDPRTAELFFDVGHTSLRLYDCTQLTPTTLLQLPLFCPNLLSLSLDLCGLTTSKVLIEWGERMKDLRRIELYGGFLIRVDGWRGFMTELGARLEGFLIR